MTYRSSSDTKPSKDLCQSRLGLIRRFYRQQLVLSKQLKTNVYFGYHADYGEVVIKFADTETEKILLQRETEFLHRCPSSSWPKWRDYQSLSGTDCLILEKLPGDPLKITESLATQPLQWLHNVEHTLVSLHQQGMIHGDIKPSNIIVDCTGKGKLIDFGATQVIGSAPKAPIAKSRFFYDTQTRHITAAKQDWQALAITVATSLNIDPFQSLPLVQAKQTRMTPNTKGIPSKYALLLKQALC